MLFIHFVFPPCGYSIAYLLDFVKCFFEKRGNKISPFLPVEKDDSQKDEGEADKDNRRGNPQGSADPNPGPGDSAGQLEDEKHNE